MFYGYSKAGISEQFEGHSAPLTGIDCHSAPGPVDFSRYFITSSMDWTAKLWNVKVRKPLFASLSILMATTVDILGFY